MKHQIQAHPVPVTDEQLTELYWQRDERAIAETDRKYGKLLFSLAYNILHDERDCEECQNDTYLGVWNTIPPTRPAVFSAFVSRIMRRIAIDKYREKTRQKRGAQGTELPIEELEDYLHGTRTVEEDYQADELVRLLNAYLSTLTERRRYIFIGRFYMGDGLAVIARELSIHTATVHREIEKIKQDLKQYLERNGVSL